MPATGIATGETSSSTEPVSIPAIVFARAQQLYNEGLCLQAFHEAEAAAPLRLWTSTPARTLAGRIAANVGGYGLARAQHWLAWRSNKRDPDLIAYNGHGVLDRRGPMAALDFLDKFAPMPIVEDGEVDARVHLLTLRATVLGHLRDFTAAEECMDGAIRLDPEHPWNWTCRAHLFELQDRYQEAVEAARQSLVLRPKYRPGIQTFAHSLQLLDRHEEALEFLVQITPQLENMHVMRQLFHLQTELGLHTEAAASLDRFEELAPLIKKDEKGWVQRQRIAIHCRRQDWAAALAGARQIDEPCYVELAQRLETNAPRKEVLLRVPFVRQHHMTCVPATLATISRFWNKPAEHLEVAEAICYDGTPAHSERTWADTHGWATREFTLSWDMAKSLLDRGIPFTLTTNNATSGHLQAVVGYDEIRRTLWIRDPFIYDKLEFNVDPLIEAHRSRGPRCMALVPAEQRGLFDGLSLPESPLYDQLFGVEAALARHDRSAASQICQEMQQGAPDHRLTLYARRAMAAYDGNTPALLEVFDLLLKQFPQDASLLLAKAQCLHDLARRKERLDFLEEICAKPGSDPVFWLQYAQELRLDARQHGVAAGWVRWAMRYRPLDPAALSAWGDLLSDRRELTEAVRFYRFAACLGEKNEFYSQKFFAASFHVRQTETALEFLRKRDTLFGRLAAYPTMTLVDSLQHLRRAEEALRVLDAALARRPQDGALHLFAADFYARLSRFDIARKLIEEVKPHCAPVAWQRAAATAAGYENRKAEALAHWLEVLQSEPLAHDAMQAAALLLAETQGRSAALKFLDELCHRFPCSCPLLKLRIGWLDEDGPTAMIPRLRELLEVNPADAWAWRELSVQTSQLNNQEPALGAAEEAIRIEPNRSTGYSVRGMVFLRMGRLAEAQNDFRQALGLEVDNEYAMSQYVHAANSVAQRKDALAIVAKELRRQVIFQNALFAYQDAARGLLPAEEVLGLLREAHAARPDLCQAWSVLVHQLVDLGKYDEALELAKKATERFPLVPEIWVDLARTERARLNDPGQVAALEKALDLRPGFGFASRELAAAFRRQHKLAEARHVLEEAISANPLDALNHGTLAEVLWDQGEREAAIARAQHALGLHPGYDWPWDALAEWGPEAGRPRLAVETARELTRLRAGEARSWLRLAESLSPETDADELFAALDKALELNPRSEAAFDARARALSKLNRCDEALAQCRPAAIQPPSPALLLRAALIEAERGNVSHAIDLAKEIVAEHPDYYNAWKLLSDLHMQTGGPELAVKDVERMAELAPLNPVPLGYLGELKLRLGDTQAAQSAFERAFTLAPEYGYAGLQLFHLQVQQRDFDAADRTLQVLSRRGENAEFLSCAVKLCAASEDEHRAADYFGKLCRAEDAEPWAVHQAAQAMDTDLGPRLAREILDSCVHSDACTPAVATCWVDRQIQLGRWRLHRQLSLFKGAAQRAAVIYYLSKLGDAFQKARDERDLTSPFKLRFHFRHVMSRHGSWLRSDLGGWGKVGFVLTCIGRPKPVIDWLGDWRSRDKVESWMLYNLVLMLQRMKRYPETLDVLRHLVVMRHGEDYYEYVRAWAAFEEMLAGNPGQARQHLANLPAQPKKDLLPICSMTKLLLGLREQPPGDAHSARQRIRSELRQAFRDTPPFRAEAYVRLAYHRCLQAAEISGAGPQTLWRWWFYRSKDWLWFGLATLCLPAAFAAPPLLAGFIAYFAINSMRKRQH